MTDAYAPPEAKPIPFGRTLNHPCPDCGGTMVLRPSRYGPFYGCARWPDCAASHGAHAATGDPLGTPADKETKAWRIRAHDAFDATWRGKRSRGSAYRALAAYLGISRGKCHIGMFDADLCARTAQYAENEGKNV